MNVLKMLAVIVGAAWLAAGGGALLMFLGGMRAHQPIHLADVLIPPARIVLGLALIVWGARGTESEDLS